MRRIFMTRPARGMNKTIASKTVKAAIAVAAQVRITPIALSDSRCGFPRSFLRELYPM